MRKRKRNTNSILKPPKATATTTTAIDHTIKTSVSEPITRPSCGQRRGPPAAVAARARQQMVLMALTRPPWPFRVFRPATNRPKHLTRFVLGAVCSVIRERAVIEMFPWMHWGFTWRYSAVCCGLFLPPHVWLSGSVALCGCVRWGGGALLVNPL